MQFEIVTDSSSNLTDAMIEEFGIHILPLRFMSDGEEFQSFTEGEKSDLQRFYDMMRDGKVFTTSLPYPDKSEAKFRSILDSGRDVLYLGFSSGLSGTFEAMANILEALKPEYPDRKIAYVDTLAAAMGEGLLVYKAAQKAREGASIEETAQWVTDNRLNLGHWFTVEDLMYLFRGGRVSRTSAWAGSLLNIKPVLHVDDEGHLIPMDKVRGRKKSIMTMVDHMEKTGLAPMEDQTVFISHADCEEDLMILVEEIRKRFGCKDIRWNYLDPVIGAHTGPGCLALFFMASER
ncbi:MAG: DegV family protein [Coriobacteriaceae bacterium]|nr:DegV family protein [Coriobacteriaceae bacterium]